MSHKLSLACYAAATSDSHAAIEQYADLQSILHLFGLINTESKKNLTNLVVFPPMTHPPGLLLVEDDPDISELIELLLIKAGYPEQAIHTSSTGEEAIHYVQNHPVGVALLDIRLVDASSVAEKYISGLEVLKVIKESSPGAKVILVSAYGTYEMVKEAILKMGASYYLSKPFNSRDLLLIVRWCLERVLGPEILLIDSGGPPHSESGVQRPEKILFVDDDVAVAGSLALALRTFGYQTESTDQVLEALDRVSRSEFDALVLDLKMPAMDGIEMLNRLAQFDHNTIVIVLTGLGDAATARRAMELGAYAYFTKPCDLSSLRIHLEYAFASREASG